MKRIRRIDLKSRSHFSRAFEAARNVIDKLISAKYIETLGIVPMDYAYSPGLRYPVILIVKTRKNCKGVGVVLVMLQIKIFVRLETNSRTQRG
jgi:hypothetical protein